jgi:hypothetical protein
MPPYLASLSPLSCGLLGWLVTASSHYPRQCEALCTRCAPLAVGVTSAPFGSLSGENALDARVLAGVGSPWGQPQLPPWSGGAGVCMSLRAATRGCGPHPGLLHRRYHAQGHRAGRRERASVLADRRQHALQAGTLSLIGRAIAWHEVQLSLRCVRITLVVNRQYDVHMGSGFLLLFCSRLDSVVGR